MVGLFIYKDITFEIVALLNLKMPFAPHEGSNAMSSIAALVMT